MKLRDYYYHYDLRNTLVRIGPDVIPSLIRLVEETGPGTAYYNSPQESAVAVLGQLGSDVAVWRIGRAVMRGGLKESRLGGHQLERARDTPDVNCESVDDEE